MSILGPTQSRISPSILQYTKVVRSQILEYTKVVRSQILQYTKVVRSHPGRLRGWSRDSPQDLGLRG